MQAKAFRMLVMYVSKEEVIAGVFHNQIAVFEQAFPYEKKTPAELCLHLLASLDREGMNLSKLQVVCVPRSLDTTLEDGKKEVDYGVNMACYISGQLNIPAYFVVFSQLPQTRCKYSTYQGDRYLLSLAEQTLFILTGDD
ncbi:hypothetical protein MKZ02_09965 [Pseudobacillus sp. FSL P4-0506]|uniref:hypothetical protein n=1 Tax=unclassified Pseudobacillus TaxID=2619284 RepID=UPI0030F9D392